MARSLKVVSIQTFPSGEINVDFADGPTLQTIPAYSTGGLTFANEAQMKERIADVEGQFTREMQLLFHLAITYLKNDGTLANPTQVIGKTLTFDQYAANPLRIQ